MSNEWRTVERKQIRMPIQQSDGTKELVKEILATPLGDRSYKRPQKEPEWECTFCNTPNFATRFRCRDCAKPRNTGRAGSTATPAGKAKGSG